MVNPSFRLVYIIVWVFWSIPKDEIEWTHAARLGENGGLLAGLTIAETPWPFRQKGWLNGLPKQKRTRGRNTTETYARQPAKHTSTLLRLTIPRSTGGFAGTNSTSFYSEPQTFIPGRTCKCRRKRRLAHVPAI
ncbi:unnamed protein product [Ectocarpus sp. 12 AP-2014]